MSHRWISRQVQITATVLVVITLAVLAFRLMPAAPALAQGGGQPVTTYTLFEPQRLTGGVAYTAAPQLTSTGVDITRITNYDTADVFVSVIGEPGFVLTSTVQFSPDRTNWASLAYETWDYETVSTTVVQRYQTTDGTEYFQVANVGTNLRVMLEGEGVYTPTVKAIYRNMLGDKP